VRIRRHIGRTSRALAQDATDPVDDPRTTASAATIDSQKQPHQYLPSETIPKQYQKERKKALFGEFGRIYLRFHQVLYNWY
jgi:hypothetical protein